MLQDYAGMRFDHVTLLKYATYRQSVDAGNNLAIALQFNVDYDLTDQNTSWQGRIVFEPYQGIGGNVLQGEWQTWDAKAGRWWGTKASVVRGNTTVANPCVQSTPCTWNELLAAFPNSGVHATYGAVILKAGSGWTGFRGNVDSLAIGIDSAITVFNFDSASSTPSAHLRARVAASVLGSPLPRDSDYALGAVIHYDFSAAPGHDGPFVILDDTIAAATGIIVMDHPHSIAVAADSVYTAAALSGDAQAYAQRITSLLSTSDKASAFADLLQYSIDRLGDGISAADLERQEAIAWRVAFDPVRDSAAWAATDAALDGYLFDFWADDPSTRYVVWEAPATSSQSSPQRSSGSTRPARARAHRARVEQKLATSAMSQTAVDDDESPNEPTVFIYVNGVGTDENPQQIGAGAATVTAARLQHVLLTMPRFGDGLTHVVYRYNRRWQVQMAQYDAEHPCERAALRRSFAIDSPESAADAYIRCEAPDSES